MNLSPKAVDKPVEDPMKHDENQGKPESTGSLETNCSDCLGLKAHNDLLVAKLEKAEEANRALLAEMDALRTELLLRDADWHESEAKTSAVRTKFSSDSVSYALKAKWHAELAHQIRAALAQGPQ